MFSHSQIMMLIIIIITLFTSIAVYTNVGQLLEILGWKNLDSQQNTQKEIIMIFKYLHGLALDYLALKLSQHNTSYNLRDSGNKLNVRLPHTNYYTCLAPM